MLKKAKKTLILAFLQFIACFSTPSLRDLSPSNDFEDGKW